MGEHHGPIWIDNPRVDSETMLEAYLASARAEHPWYGQLKMEQHIHAVRGTHRAEVPPGCVKAKCTVPHCFRCEIQQGGYRFQWMHALWLPYYEQHKRHGAWSISETTDDTARLDAVWQARQPEHQRKMRARMDDFNRALRAADGDMLMYIKNLYKLQLSAGR
jgi:hypothetical protein